MKTWKKLLEKDWNDAYDMYENPEDVLEEYKFALVDLAHEDIFEVASTKEYLMEEVTSGNGFEYYSDDISKLAILNIETDEVYIAETTFTWQKYANKL